MLPEVKNTHIVSFSSVVADLQSVGIGVHVAQITFTAQDVSTGTFGLVASVTTIVEASISWISIATLVSGYMGSIGTNEA